MVVLPAIIGRIPTIPKNFYKNLTLFNCCCCTGESCIFTNLTRTDKVLITYIPIDSKFPCYNLTFVLQVTKVIQLNWRLEGRTFIFSVIRCDENDGAIYYRSHIISIRRLPGIDPGIGQLWQIYVYNIWRHSSLSVIRWKSKRINHHFILHAFYKTCFRIMMQKAVLGTISGQSVAESLNLISILQTWGKLWVPHYIDLSFNQAVDKPW